MAKKVAAPSTSRAVHDVSASRSLSEVCKWLCSFDPAVPAHLRTTSPRLTASPLPLRRDLLHLDNLGQGRELDDSQSCTSINSSAPNKATMHLANVFHDLVSFSPVTT